MHHSGLHITTNFHIMKWWIQSRKGTPAIISLQHRKYPAILFSHRMNKHAQPVSWTDFFDCITDNGLAFMYEADHEDMNKGEFCKLVPWEEYIDEIRVEEKEEDKAIIAQNCFS